MNRFVFVVAVMDLVLVLASLLSFAHGVEVVAAGGLVAAMIVLAGVKS